MPSDDYEMSPHAIAVKPLADYKLFITFKNGEQKIFDAKPLLKYSVYKSLEKNFSAVSIDHGVVVWPGDRDIDPDKLYLKSVSVEKSSKL